jgi:hypothetical protein
MRCTGPSRRACVTVVFCRWPRFNIGIRGGTITTVRCAPTVLCWTWTYSEHVATPLLEECEDDTHTPEMGTWESFGTPKTSELDYRGQNTLHWGALYIIGKLWQCRCRKWACMGHLDICSTSYVQKKGQKSNWHFDSQPLKVGNQPDPGVCRGECNTPLESSQGEIQVCLKPRSNWRS